MSDQATQPNVPACELALRTDPGRDPDKQINEDSAAHADTSLGLLAVVCDGMGGHAGGKEASELAVRTIVEHVQAAPPGSPPGDVLRRALTLANEAVWNMPTAEAGLRPGSTAVVVLVHAGGAEIAHVGDSRVYLVHSGAISQVTRDHSMVQELVDRNIIKAEDAAKHPDANKILRALGIAKEVEVDVRPDPVAYVSGDVFILCSDGLSDLVAPAEILETTGSHPVAQAAGRLVDLANARGGHDNITALLVRTKTSSAPQSSPTLAKTLPLTAAGAPPAAEVPKTVVAAPIAAATQQPPQPPGPAPHAPPPQHPRPPQAAPPPVTPGAMPSSPTPMPTPVRSEASRLPAIVALVATLVVLVVAGVAWLHLHKEHKPVPLIEEPPKDSGTAASPDDEDAEGPPIETVAPLIPTQPGPRWDGGRSADPCVGAARAKANGAPDAVVKRLEEKCRAAEGGAPSGTASAPTIVPLPSPSPTPSPRPSPTPKPTVAPPLPTTVVPPLPTN